MPSWIAASDLFQLLSSSASRTAIAIDSLSVRFRRLSRGACSSVAVVRVFEVPVCGLAAVGSRKEMPSANSSRRAPTRRWNSASSKRLAIRDRFAMASGPDSGSAPRDGQRQEPHLPARILDEEDAYQLRLVWRRDRCSSVGAVLGELVA